MPPRLSLTARLALLFALLTASLLIVVGVVLGRAVEAHFDELDTHELAGKLTLVGNLVREAGSDAGQHLDAAFAGQDTVGLLLRAADGTVLHAIQPGAFHACPSAGAALMQGGEGWHSGPRQFIGRELALDTAATPAMHCAWPWRWTSPTMRTSSTRYDAGCGWASPRPHWSPPCSAGSPRTAASPRCGG